MTNITLLHRLGDIGFTELPADRIGDLAAWCWDQSETSGDARFCFLARMLEAVNDWWTEYDTVSTQLLQDIDDLVTAELPVILETAEAAEAARMARSLRERVAELLLPPDAWPQPEGN